MVGTAEAAAAMAEVTGEAMVEGEVAAAVVNSTFQTFVSPFLPANSHSHEKRLTFSCLASIQRWLARSEGLVPPSRYVLFATILTLQLYQLPISVNFPPKLKKVKSFVPMSTWTPLDDPRVPA